MFLLHDKLALTFGGRRCHKYMNLLQDEKGTLRSEWFIDRITTAAEVILQLRLHEREPSIPVGGLGDSLVGHSAEGPGQDEGQTARWRDGTGPGPRTPAAARAKP